MRATTCLFGAVVALSGMVVYLAHATADADGQAAPIFGIKVPPGYRDWRLISVAQEEGRSASARAAITADARNSAA